MKHSTEQVWASLHLAEQTHAPVGLIVNEAREHLAAAIEHVAAPMDRQVRAKFARRCRGGRRRGERRLG